MGGGGGPGRRLSTASTELPWGKVRVRVGAPSYLSWGEAGDVILKIITYMDKRKCKTGPAWNMPANDWTNPAPRSSYVQL